MHRLLKNSRHCFDAWSSHFTLLENPEYLVQEVVDFMRHSNHHIVRRTSVQFDNMEQHQTLVKCKQEIIAHDASIDTSKQSNVSNANVTDCMDLSSSDHYNRRSICQVRTREE